MAPTAGKGWCSNVGVRAFALSLALLAPLVGCKDDQGTTPEDGLDRRTMVASVAKEVVAPATAAASSKIAALVTAVEAYTKALGGGDGASERQAAQKSWREAMVAWQHVEVMQLGPAALKTSPGGEGQRDKVYSWPTVSPCAVDQQIENKGYESPTFVEDKLVNVSGFDALEYLLFYAGADNACPSGAAINRDKLWEKIDAAELKKRRADYALVVAKGLAKTASALAEAWQVDKGNFANELATAGKGSNVYASDVDALDALFAALFYLDVRVKDLKVGVPAGLHDDCKAERCPESRESPWANHSKENVIANLEAALQIFRGGPGAAEGKPGFDDLLVASEAASVAKQVDADLVAAIAKAKALSGSFEDVLGNEPKKLEELHAAIKKVTSALKNEFVVALKVKVPPLGAGDTD